MIINTNIASLNTQNQLNGLSKDIQQALERLSSGKNLNGASDNAAGLAITTRMDAVVRGLDVKARNTNDNISLLQTAEAGQSSIVSILQRMRELALQAGNGTYTASDKGHMQSEYAQLRDEIDHIAQTTSFNGIPLLNAPFGFVMMTMYSEPTVLTGGAYAVITLHNSTSGSLGVGALNFSGCVDYAILSIDNAIGALSSYRSDYGAMENRLSFTLENITSTKENIVTALSRIRDADMAQELSRKTRDQIISQSALSMLSQANQQPQSLLKLLS